MTLSGSFKFFFYEAFNLVLIPLLVDDPLRDCLTAGGQVDVTTRLNPSFSG